MKTWEAAIDDIARVNHYPCKPLGLAGRDGISYDRYTIGLVVPAFTGDRCDTQDCLLF